MKILVITQYFYPETFRVNTLCIELAKRGHDVTVLTGFPQYPQGKIYDGYGFRKPYQKEWNGIKIERIKMRPRGKTPIGLLLNCWSFVLEGKKWVKKCNIRYDAVYVFEVSPVTVGLPAVAYKKKFDTPIFFNVQDLWPENVEVVLGIHNKFVISVINKIVDKIYSASDRILCASNGFVQNIAARGVSREKLVFWPQFYSNPDFEKAVKPSIYDNNSFNIVFAGNLGYAQGLDLLIDAAILLKNEKIKWFLVGDGHAKEGLQQRVFENKLQNQICFVGKVSEEEANRYIHFADCAYLSLIDNKLFELTIPAKLQTYMACATPVLAVVSGESANIIRQAECGFVCEPNAKTLCEVIQSAARASQELVHMGDNGRVYFEKHFDIKMLLDELETMMNESLNDKFRLRDPQHRTHLH